MSEVSPRYATVLYDVRRQLDISFISYVYLDMVHKLSYQRWCSKSLLHCADDLGISRRHMIRIKNDLLDKKLIEKNSHGYVRVTTKYTGVAVTKSHQQAVQVVTKSPKVVTKSHLASDNMSLIENNNRITENKGKHDFASKLAIVPKDAPGYLKAKLMRDRLKKKGSAYKAKVS